MINKPPPFKGLNIRIPIKTPTQGRGFVNQGSGLGFSVQFIDFRDQSRDDSHLQGMGSTPGAMQDAPKP